MPHVGQKAPRQLDAATLQQLPKACGNTHRQDHPSWDDRQPVIVLLSCATQLVHTLIILMPIGGVTLISRAHPPATPARPVGPAQVCISPVHGPCQALGCLFNGSATPIYHNTSMTYHALQHM